MKLYYLGRKRPDLNYIVLVFAMQILFQFLAALLIYGAIRKEPQIVSLNYKIAGNAVLDTIIDIALDIAINTITDTILAQILV